MVPPLPSNPTWKPGSHPWLHSISYFSSANSTFQGNPRFLYLSFCCITHILSSVLRSNIMFSYLVLLPPESPPFRSAFTLSLDIFNRGNQLILFWRVSEGKSREGPIPSLKSPRISFRSENCLTLIRKLEVEHKFINLYF